MSNDKKSKGLLAFVTGAVMGAAAAFFANKDNREKTKEIVDDTVKKAKKLKKDIEQDPQKVVKGAQKKAKKVIDQAKKKIEKAKK